MTLRLVLGIDPGQTGAVAECADGQIVGVYDLPTRTRKGKTERQEMNPSGLAALLREIRARHAGAAELVAIENVQPMPSRAGGVGMGAVSAFQYGRGIGAIEGVVETLGLPLNRVHASRWKRDEGLQGQPKDYARTVAINRHPNVATELKRKKDIGRADSILIADWAYKDMVGEAAVPEDPFDLRPKENQQMPSDGAQHG